MRRYVPEVFVSTRSPLLQVLKTFVAASAAWLACIWLLDQPVPIFAAIAALLVVQPSVNQSLAKGVERSVGVILGVIIAFAAVTWFGSSVVVVIAVILVSLLVAWALKLTPGSSNQIPISALLVVALGAATPGYGAERILETIIGAVIGLVVNVAIVPPVHSAPAHAAVAQLAEGIGSILDDLSTALRTPTSFPELDALLQRARGLRGQLQKASDAISAADESLMLNPRGRKHRERIDHDRKVLASLGVLVTRVLGMTRAVRDHYSPGLSDDRIVRSIAVELERAGHDVRLLAAEPRPEHIDLPTAQLPALTAPLVIAQPHPEHWILVGSLMEDLRRVREELAGQLT